MRVPNLGVKGPYGHQTLVLQNQLSTSENTCALRTLEIYILFIWVPKMHEKKNQNIILAFNKIKKIIKPFNKSNIFNCLFVYN